LGYLERAVQLWEQHLDSDDKAKNARMALPLANLGDIYVQMVSI